MHRLTATDTPMVRYTRTIFPSYAGTMIQTMILVMESWQKVETVCSLVQD